MTSAPYRKAAPTEVLPPNDVMAEEAVIAALMLDGAVRNDDYKEMVSEAVAMLRPSDFFRDQHAWVFSACLAIRGRGDEVTWVEVAHELERMGHLEAMGGVDALVEIAGRHFTAYGIVGHARIVARCSLYRRLIQAAGFIAQVAYEASPETDRVVGVVREAIDRALGTVPANVVSIRSIYDRPEYQEVSI